MALRHHAVLAAVSRSCPPPRDKFLRVTHPSATDSRNCPCDLHVLSMPPAFALSQDQTLRFIPASHLRETKTNRPELIGSPISIHPALTRPTNIDHRNYCLRISRRIHKQTPQSYQSAQANQHKLNPSPPLPQKTRQNAAHVSLPFLIQLSKNQTGEPAARQRLHRVGRRVSRLLTDTCQRDDKAPHPASHV